MLLNCSGCARRKAWLQKQATRLRRSLTGHPAVPRQVVDASRQQGGLKVIDFGNVRSQSQRGWGHDGNSYG
jgi:hypothetical protein